MNSGVAVEKFQYASTGLSRPSRWKDLPIVSSDDAVNDDVGSDEVHREEHNASKESTESLAASAQISFEAGRAKGLEEGRQLGREEEGIRFQEMEVRRIESTSRIVDQVARERESFLRAVEPEVVKLALSIASRILRHEAQTDPLFLAGAVRVALGQLAETVPVRLRVPATDFKLWSETIARLPNLNVKPTVIAGEDLAAGECMIETDLGSLDLGVGSQLSEIATMFFDGAARSQGEGQQSRSGQQ
jgi:flagellar biosynthesis/type III secretory pathway protein FliH